MPTVSRIDYGWASNEGPRESVSVAGVVTRTARGKVGGGPTCHGHSERRIQLDERANRIDERVAHAAYEMVAVPPVSVKIDYYGDQCAAGTVAVVTFQGGTLGGKKIRVTLTPEMVE